MITDSMTDTTMTDTTMTDTTMTVKAAGPQRHSARYRRLRLVGILLPAGMAAMVLVDHLLGDRAEYFHAGRLLEAWTELFRGGSIDTVHFIIGQSEMGSGLALLVGTGVFVLEPGIVLAALVFGGSQVPRALRAVRAVRPARRGSATAG